MLPPLHQGRAGPEVPPGPPSPAGDTGEPEPVSLPSFPQPWQFRGQLWAGDSGPGHPRAPPFRGLPFGSRRLLGCSGASSPSAPVGSAPGQQGAAGLCSRTRTLSLLPSPARSHGHSASATLSGSRSLLPGRGWVGAGAEVASGAFSHGPHGLIRVTESIPEL